MLFRRDKLALLVAELIGTFTLTFVVLTVSKSAIGIPYFVAIATGLALAMVIFMLGKEMGIHANPAVTFGMWSIKKIGTLQGLLFIAVQFMGAAFAWKLYTYFTNAPIQSIASKSFDWRIFTAELVGTAFFLMGISAAVYRKYEGGKAAAAIGGSLIIGIIIASSISNGVINPAIALGIQSWSKEYVLGPLVGGFIGANLYALLFAGESFAINPRRVSLPSKVSFSSQKTKTAASKTTKKTAKKKK